MAVTLKEAIEFLESSQWISLRFITADVNKGTGGKVLEFTKCRIARGYNDKSQPLPQLGYSVQGEEGVRRNPNHSYNFTRNIELPNKQLRKVHPLLITHINSQAVI